MKNFTHVLLQKIKSGRQPMSLIAAFLAVCLMAQHANGQCTALNSFGTATINPTGSVVTITTCMFAGEYATIQGAVSGQTLRFTSSIPTDYITIHSGTPSGPVIDFGTTPLTINNPFTGTLYMHLHASPACVTQSTCREPTVQSLVSIPTITCPGNQSADASETCDAVVTYSSSFTGQPAPDITYQFSGATTGSGSGNGSGSSFNTGITTVLLSATNTGGTASCSFSVEVTDHIPPVITCPADISVPATPGLCSAIVTYSAPTATDNCSKVIEGSQTFSYTGSLQTFTVPAGVATITIEAKGAQGGAVTGNSPYPEGGLGAIMKGDFDVTSGQVLNIIVGGRGNPDYSSSGGGGASGVGLESTPWIIAGGGAGVDFQDPSYPGIHAAATPNGNAGNSNPGSGGIAGNSGGDWIYEGSNISRGGRGWNAGNSGSTGQDGVSANTSVTNGTFGVGGGGGSVGYGWCNCGGGGGGYSGGGSGNINSSGGGGGSFNTGSNQENTGGIHQGNGIVIISWSQNTNPVPIQTSGLASGSTFPVGTTTNTFVATDEAGNSANCSFTVTVENTEPQSISGYARYYNNPKTPLDGLKVTLKKNGSVVGTPVITGTNGFYNFPGLTSGIYDLMLTSAHPSGDWQTWNGVNNTDYLLVSRHATGVALLQTEPPVVRVSADVIDPQTLPIITTLDATAVKNAAKYGWFKPNTTTPWFDIPKWVFSGTTTANAISGFELNCNSVTRDIYGLCAGDVNGSYVPPSGWKQAPANMEIVNRGQIALSPEIIFPVRIQDDLEIGAITLMLDFDASLIEITGVEMPDQGDQAPWFIVNGNMLHIGWASLNPIRRIKDETLLLIHTRVKDLQAEQIRFTLNSNPLSELADGEGQVIDGAKLAIADAGYPILDDGGTTITVYPNPAKDVLNIEYQMSVAGDFHAELVTIQGVVVSRLHLVNNLAGWNKAIFRLGDVPQGVYLLRTTCGDQQFVTKVMVNR